MTDLQQALDVLRSGGVVAAATETYFGLLADAANPHALDRLFEIKPRELDKGVGLLVPSFEQWRRLVYTTARAEEWAREHWPGPLTLVLPARPYIDSRLTAGGTLGVRQPGASPAAKLVQQFGGPLTATSANPPGRPPARTSQQVLAEFSSHPAVHVLEGHAPGGLASTVVAIRDEQVSIIRRGPIEILV